MAKTPSSTEVATTTSTEIEALSDAERALIEANQAEVDPNEFVIPLLKLAQPLTEEVTAGAARPGDFVLALTRESFGPKIEFVVAGKGKGRFKPGRDGQRTLTCYDTPIVPWQQDPFFGQPFSEHPDAEEKYRERVNDKEIEWGGGPPIQTTFNYTGHIIGSDVPVRLSLRRTSAPAARKWNTILDAVLRGRYWDVVFEVESEQVRNAKGTFYTVTVTQARKTTPEERGTAVELAQVLRNASVRVAGDEESARPAAEPDSEGGLGL